MSVIAIITYSDFPNGSPGAIRYATFAYSLIDMGYQVVVFHKAKDCSIENSILTIPIYSENKYIRFVQFGFKVIKELRKQCKKRALQGVIIGADVHTIHATFISLWCRLHNIKCIFDVTEWYSKEQFTNWKISTSYWMREVLNRVVIGKRQRVIAISSYLYNYFNRKGCKVVRIPIIYNEKLYDKPLVHKNRLDNKLSIIYAGSHLKMDNIPLVIEAISLLSDAERCNIQFVIYGLSEEKIRMCVPSDIFAKAQYSLRVMGRRPNAEVMEAYAFADFSIVLRDPTARVNRAGFPSKVVESMHMGIPVLCNYSSDLNLYLTHNENSIVIDELDANKLCVLFQELVSMPKSEKDRIGQNAACTVHTQLCAKQFEQQFIDIIS